MSADKYPSIFSRQMVTIVYISARAVTNERLFSNLAPSPRSPGTVAEWKQSDTVKLFSGREYRSSAPWVGNALSSFLSLTSLTFGQVHYFIYLFFFGKITKSLTEPLVASISHAEYSLPLTSGRENINSRKVWSRSQKYRTSVKLRMTHVSVPLDFSSFEMWKPMRV